MTVQTLYIDVGSHIFYLYPLKNSKKTTRLIRILTNLIK